MTVLYWLPEIEDWRGRLRTLGNNPEAAWEQAVGLANSRLDFIRTNALDQTLLKIVGDTPPKSLGTKPIRLALLGSSTMAHLHPAIRVAGLRRGLWISIYENDYGQYWQELTDPSSALHEFKPDVVLFALDPHHLAAGLGANLDRAEAEQSLDEVQDRIRECWRLARESFRCPVMQQLPLPVHPTLLGNNLNEGTLFLTAVVVSYGGTDRACRGRGKP